MGIILWIWPGVIVGCAIDPFSQFYHEPPSALHAGPPWTLWMHLRVRTSSVSLALVWAMRVSKGSGFKLHGPKRILPLHGTVFPIAVSSPGPSTNWGSRVHRFQPCIQPDKRKWIWSCSDCIILGLRRLVYIWKYMFQMCISDIDLPWNFKH